MYQVAEDPSKKQGQAPCVRPPELLKRFVLFVVEK